MLWENWVCHQVEAVLGSRGWELGCWEPVWGFGSWSMNLAVILVWLS